MTQTPLVVGIFQDEASARNAIDALRTAGFGYDQVGVATHESGAATRNLKSDLINLNVPEQRATYYDNEFKAGRTVVSIRPDGRDAEATNIIRSNGGYDNGSTGAGYGQGQTANTAGTYAATGATGAGATMASNRADETDEQRTLRLRAEQLNVTKERVQAGDVELHKEVVAEQQTINVPVTHEEVVIEHRAVTDHRIDNTPIGQDEVIRIPVSEEQVEVTKNTVVTDEVSVGKRAVQEMQQVTDTVRHEEVRVEEQGDVSVHGTSSDRFHGNQTDPNANPTI